MIGWAKLKKKIELRELEFNSEEKKMSEIQRSNNFRPVGEKTAAILLGISYSKIKTLRRQGKIPFLRIGRSVKYTLPILEKFLEKGFVEAQK
ncbi:MAG: helix-turn-helix domain-containing protein [Pyrinomonadaceae bacterium]